MYIEVGYTGWALVGGMGPFMNSYGLGADQIIAAKVVNAHGELVDANERLLKGLRGGGGSLAIVVELVIKAYPLNEIQSGMLLHDSTDMRKAISTFFTNFAALLDEHQGELPSKLAVLPGVLPVLGFGPVSGAIIVWNGPVDDESKEWIGRIASLAPLMPGIPGVDAAIMTTTAYGFTQYLNSMLPATVTGRCHTANVSSFTPEVIDNLAESAASIPAGFTGGLNMHMLRANRPSCSGHVPDSVLPCRKPHIMLELLGFGSDEESSNQAAQWALEARNRFVNCKSSTGSTYLPLTAPEFLDLERTYGDKLAELKNIKAEVDPDGVFQHTVPALI
ncbi:FAD-binding, type 2 [Metarhizium rileyi]|uniref:FAD-binding, type 2 n=1 Tax=Metarhizium rileyi (strain RCEF 4871) TaxID=1649241 RepID=A0A162LRY0_METRR|nr:FAD-binding, type 2 [Metarhizium rileyi RCEF 4871]